MRDLGPNGEDFSRGVEINDHGVVAGVVEHPFPEDWDDGDVFLWFDGVMHNLGGEGVGALNERDEVAVNSWWGHGSTTSLTSLDGHISEPGPSGCDVNMGKWSVDLNDRTEWLVACYLDINRWGQVTGSSELANGVPHAFIWTPRTAHRR